MYVIARNWGNGVRRHAGNLKLMKFFIIWVRVRLGNKLWSKLACSLVQCYFGVAIAAADTIGEGTTEEDTVGEETDDEEFHCGETDFVGRNFSN